MNLTNVQYSILKATADDEFFNSVAWYIEQRRLLGLPLYPTKGEATIVEPKKYFFSGRKKY